MLILGSRSQLAKEREINPLDSAVVRGLGVIAFMCLACFFDWRLTQIAAKWGPIKETNYNWLKNTRSTLATAMLPVGIVLVQFSQDGLTTGNIVTIIIVVVYALLMLHYYIVIATLWKKVKTYPDDNPPPLEYPFLPIERKHGRR